MSSSWYECGHGLSSVAILAALPSGYGTNHETRHFDKSGTRYRLQLCNVPLSLAAIRMIVELPVLFAPEPSPITLGSSGIRAVFESERVTIGQGQGQLHHQHVSVT
jgi:hypothetical protein